MRVRVRAREREFPGTRKGLHRKDLGKTESHRSTLFSMIFLSY